MKYKKERTIEDGRYCDKYSLIIPYAILPSEFQEDLKVGNVEEPEIFFSEEGMVIMEESTHG